MAKLIRPNEKPATFKVVIGIPSGDEVKTGFAHDLTQMVGFTAATDPNIAIIPIFYRSSILPGSRHGLVLEALDLGATHILWLDSDMRFPKDTLTRLLSHKEPIVAGLYPSRKHPVIPTALKAAEDGALEPVYLEEGARGLLRVSVVGMGVMLVDMDVFRNLPAPWFLFMYHQESNQYSGEDAYFCYHAGSRGLSILVDQDLSREISHVGEFEFKLAHADGIKEMVSNGD